MRHGGKAILLARLTAILRALTPGAPGMTGMRYRTFLVWNVVGGVVWGRGCVVLGWAFASAVTRVGQYLNWAPLAVPLHARKLALAWRAEIPGSFSHVRERSPTRKYFISRCTRPGLTTWPESRCSSERTVAQPPHATPRALLRSLR
jgi:hypothetical protein